MLPLLLALGLVSSTDPWAVSRDAASAGWTSDLASGLNPYAKGTMDFFLGGSVLDGAPGPGLLEDGVTRRERAALALQGSFDDTGSPYRYGLAWLYDRGGWQDRLTWNGEAPQLSGSTWGWGLLVAWRPLLQAGAGVLVRQSLVTPDSTVADRRTEAWGLLRFDRLSLLAVGNQQKQSLWELAWQVEPVYSPADDGMPWREFSMGARYVSADRNVWSDGREAQLFGTVPLWRDRMRLQWQAGERTPWERATIQSDMLPQGLVGLDLSYAHTRWTPREWGLRVRLFAFTAGCNDPDDIRDFGPTGGNPVYSVRIHLAFNGPDDYFSPGRHSGPSDKISETSRAL